MIKNQSKYIGLILALMFTAIAVQAQVKIGDNHRDINPGAILELETLDKGLLFPRVELEDDLTIWTLEGDEPSDGMIVFNTRHADNPQGLYVWYDSIWNHFSDDGNSNEWDSLRYSDDTRLLFDDGDSVVISSGRVDVVDSTEVLLTMLRAGETLEGDIYFVPGEGLFIRNGLELADGVHDGFYFMSAMPRPGRILYANYTTSNPVHSIGDFSPAVLQTYYEEPSDPQVVDVAPPNAGDGYYAFAIPNDWDPPRIFLKVKRSGDGGFYKLDNCWRVQRNLEFEGIRYQVWTLDVPLRESVMDVQGAVAQFMIE